MPTKGTEQTYEVSTPGQTSPSIVRIVTETSEQLAKNYERLKWVGFTSMTGVLIIIATFVLSVNPAKHLPFESQLLFTITGFCMMLLSGTLFVIQNIHSFRVEIRNRKFAVKSLELQHAETTAVIAKPPASPPGGYVPPTG